MEHESSLPHAEAPLACPYPEPAQSSPYFPHPTSWRSILLLSSEKFAYTVLKGREEGE
jgi:hypothetical protein